MRDRKSIIEERSKKITKNATRRVRPVWDDILKSDSSLEHKILWQYLIVSSNQFFFGHGSGMASKSGFINHAIELVIYRQDRRSTELYVN